MIAVKGLTKYYGAVKAIEDVSFEVDQGEIVGFLGPNGAGKTTTMRILTGYSPPTRGTAVVAGFDIGEKPLEVKRRVGYLPENVPLYTEMIVRRFLEYVAQVKGMDRREKKIEADRVMERCGLTSNGNRLIQNLSKGFRQRVGLAQALIGNPPVLILDEPTVGLDPKQIIEIREMIKELAQDHTVLLSTHILPEVAMVCRRAVIIHDGRIVAQDTVEHMAVGESGLEIVVDKDFEKALKALRAIPNVGDVTDMGSGRFALPSSQDHDLAVEITKRLVEAGIGVKRLETTRRTLEEVFIEAISQDTGEGK